MSGSIIKKGLEPGIYFGLPEDIYFADTAISRSDIMALLDTPNTFWQQSWMNPAKQVKEKKEEMIFGSAFHKLLFEPKDFSNHFFIMPPEQFQRNKYMLTSTQFDQLQRSIKVLRAGKEANMFLRGGMPEVTIVFDDGGVRYRTRHDYLCVPLTTEFKTSMSIDEWHLKNEFRRRGLHVQYALYVRSRQRFKEQYAAGEAAVYGQVDKKWFHKFLEQELNDFIFIFQRKTEPFPYLPLMPEADTYDDGFDDIEKTRRIYLQYMEYYGTGRPWPVSEGKVKRFSMRYGIIDGE